MTSDKFCEMLDRIEEIGNLHLSSLRAIADIEQGSRFWSRGKCISEIICREFEDSVDRDYSEETQP